MPTISSTIRVPATPKPVFDLSQDYHLRSSWDPFTRDLKFLNGAHEPGVGVRVWVKSWIGVSMEVEYTSYRPPEAAAIKMVRGPVLFSRFAGAWKFRLVEENLTEVEFHYSFVTRWRILRPLLDPLIKFVFGGDIRRRLNAFEETIRTGRLDTSRQI